MYELNGNRIDAAQLQLAADQNNMDLETFMRTFNVVEVGDEPQQDETQVAPMQGNQNVKPLEHISFGEYNYDYEQEGDAEKHLVKKLREKYKDLPFDFDEAGMLVDKLKVTAHSGAEQTFDLSSFWNYGDRAGKRDSSYDDFINFIEQNNDADDDVVQAFKSSGLLPINYPIIDTGKRKKAVVTGREEQENIEVEKRVMRQATPKEMNSLATETRRILKDIYDNPSKYDILPSHSYDTNKIDLFMGDHREKVQDAAWNIISKNKNLIQLDSKDEFIKMLNGEVASRGMLQTTLQNAAQEEEYWNYVKAQVNQKDKNIFEDPYYKNFVDKELGIKRDNKGNIIDQDDNKKLTKYNQVKILRKSYDAIDDLQKRLLNPNENTEDLRSQILKHEEIIKEAKGVIDGLGGEGDYDITSSFYEDQGYTTASAERIAFAEKHTQQDQQSIIANIKNQAGNASLSDREAMEIYYNGLFKRYFDLQQEAKDKTMKINFTINRPITKLINLPGMEVTTSKIEGGGTRRGGNTNYTYNWEGTYADLHKNGLSSRDADGWGTFDNDYVLSEEDKTWMETHDAALDDNLGARRAMFTIHELDIDPATLKKPSGIGSVFNTSFKAFGTHFFGHTETEADENLASFSDRTTTNRFLLDEISEFQQDYNYQHKEKIEKGEVQPLTFTQEQTDQLARTTTENVTEGVGHFVPMLVELAAVTAITRGTGVPRVLQTMIARGGKYKKMLGHLGLAAIEEAKMQTVGFKPTSGAAFYTGGVLMSPYFNITGRLAWLNPLYNKTIKAGPIGAASMELATLTETAYEDFMDVKDFSAEFNDLYGNMDETTQRFITNSFVFGLVGAHNIKAFRMRPGGKIGLGTDLMTTGAKFRAIKEIKQAQEGLLKKAGIKDYKDLKGEAKEKYDAYTETIHQFERMTIVEEMSKELDVTDPNFEANFEKRYTRPFEKIIQEAVGKDANGNYLYKGYDVRFVEGKNKNFHGGKNMSPAQFIEGGGKQGKDLIIFNKEVYNKDGYKGKEIHEFIGHAAFRAIESANPGMTLQFKKNMANIFHKYDKEIGKSLTKNLDNAPESLKKIIEILESGRGREIKNEEYLAYMLEAFSNPNLYYELYATSAVKEIKSNITSFMEEIIPGYQPKIKTAEDFVGFIGRLTRDIRLDVPYAAKLTRFVADNPLNDLKVKDGRYKLNEVDLLSMEISQNPRRNVEKKMNSADLVSENNRLEAKLKEAKSDAVKEMIRGKLIQNNMPIVNEFVKEFFRAEKGGERADFKQETLFEVVKLTNKYDGSIPYGAYIRDGLFGYNPITQKGGTVAGPIGRRGNILGRFEKTKRRQDDISIDADGSFLQLEGGISHGGSVGPNQSKAGLIVYRERLDISDKQIERIENKIDLNNLEKIDYATYEGITLDYTMELVGGIKRADRIKEAEGLVGKQIGKTKEVYTLETATQRINDKYSGESNKNIKEKLQWIFEGESTNGHANWKTYYGSMPHGAILGSGKSRIEGKSTNISDALLNGRMYEKTSRTGEEAQASASKTGQTAGLKVQQKIEIKSKEQLAEKFGIKLTPEGKVDFKQTKIKSQGKDLRAIDAGFKEMDKAIRNQVTREYLERIGNESVNPQLRDASARNALYQQIGAGKSEAVFSRDLRKAFGDKQLTKNEFVEALYLHERNSKDFIKRYGQEAHDKLKDQLDMFIADKAIEGVGETTRFVQGVKKSKFADVLFNHEYANMGSKEFKENTSAKRKYINTTKEVFDLLPAIKQNLLDGNMSLMMELAGLHRKSVGNKSTIQKEINALKKSLTTEAKENLPKEILELWKSIDYTSLKGAYNSSNFTAWRKAVAVGGKKGREMLAEYYKENPGAKHLDVFYNAWNRTLEHWVHSAKSEKIKNERLGHVFKLKKENSQQGTKGERNLSPGAYYWIPEQGYFGSKEIKDEVNKLIKDGGYINVNGGFTKFKAKNPRNEAETYVFKKYSKYEHLKSSSEQSLESALLIAENMWGVKGGASLSKYRGVYGKLSEFNMIDFIKNEKGEIIDARTSNADIYRFGKNLELAKSIYSVESGFKKTLYQEIMSSEYAYQARNIEKLMQNKVLHDLIVEGKNANKKRKGISIFDFDDTLARTNSQVIVTMPNGKKFKINATEFAKRDAELSKKGAKYDFSEFNKVIEGKKGPLFDLAMKRQGKFGSGDIFVLTARPQASAIAIHKFLKGIGLNIKLENITGLENGTAKAKSDWVKNKYIEGYNDFYFADDAIKNVRAVKNVLNNLDVKSDVQQALMSRDLNLEFNLIMAKKTGIRPEIIYSRAKAEVQGASKGKFNFFIPPTAEDFVGLLYPTLGKGKQGDANMAWYKKNLLDPYAKAEDAIVKDRHQLMKDFLALKQEIKSVPKGIRKKITEGPAKGFTREQAIRVYIWNKQKMEIPGLSKTDAKQLTSYVNKNKEIKEFADKLMLIHKGDAYNKPSSSWLAGTITTDMLEHVNTTKRSKHLAEWKANKDIIFSEANLNKYEAAFGKSARNALENILDRMESGRNRKKLGGIFQKLENEVLDWTNNSVGAIMFLNTRSAVLQTISSINYINFRENNPLAAAKAFANQPQYWKDFNQLFNSDFLVQRRDGLRININEAEIVAASEKGGVKGAISYLLNKGFLFTRYADSFAIASGGASFYRNRLNSYIKQGIPEAKAKERAFREFRELTEESQQSSRPDRISAQQASGLGRVVLAFANTPMQYARLQKRAIQDLANGRGDAKTNLSKVLYYGFVQNLIFNTLQQALLAIGFDDDPKDQQQLVDKGGNVLNGMMDSQLRGLGYGGAAVATVKNIIYKLSVEHAKDNGKYEKAAWELLDFAPPISSKVSKVRSAFRSADYDMDAMEGEGFDLFDNPAFLAGGQLISAGTNVPVDRLLLKLQNIKDATDNDNDMWAKVALLSGWSEWDLGIDEKQIEKLKEELEIEEPGRKKTVRTKGSRTKNKRSK
tara:strand:- start:615 stop:9467 length:8853 start_codon:yes stop_codon:yes gene_type:complete